MNIPIIAVVDTNGDPEHVNYAIPGNDDAVRAIELFSSKVAEAIIDGKKRRIERDMQAQKTEGDAAAAAEALEVQEPVEDRPRR
jgi:small subunit ribosomal protein S2